MADGRRRAVCCEHRGAVAVNTVLPIALRAKLVRSAYALINNRRLLGKASKWRGPKMGRGAKSFAIIFVAITVLVHCTIAQPPTADDVIEKDRASRQLAIKAGFGVATKPKWGFFGTIFNVIVQQVNDTKSAYSQISELINNQFSDNNTTKTPNTSNNGTTETPKITRAEFLRILDRNLKGLARLRNLEWREAGKDSLANLRAYTDEIFRGKKSRNRR